MAESLTKKLVQLSQLINAGDRTPVIPARNKWFTDPSKPSSQRMQWLIKKVAENNPDADLSSFVSGQYVTPGGVIVPAGSAYDNVAFLSQGLEGPAAQMSVGQPLDPSQFTPVKSQSGKALSNLIQQFDSDTGARKFTPKGGDTDLKALATVARSGVGAPAHRVAGMDSGYNADHVYGRGVEFRDGGILHQEGTGNPTLRPASANAPASVYVGDEIGRVGIGRYDHPVFDKITVTGPDAEPPSNMRLLKSILAAGMAGGLASQGQAAEFTPEERESILSAGDDMTPEQKSEVWSSMREEMKPGPSGVPLDQYLSEYQPDETKLNDYEHEYAVAVNDSLDRPVISVAAAVENLGDESIASRYEGGYLSIRDMIREQAAMKNSSEIYGYLMKRRGGRPLTAAENKTLFNSIIYPAAERVRQLPSENEGRVGGVLAGTLRGDAEATELANSYKNLVREHATGGRYALDPSRTQSEQDAVDAELGDYGKYSLTQAGRQNHEADRLGELWSARSEAYPPAGTMAQVQRAIGGLTAPIYNYFTGNSQRSMGSAWDEMSRMAEPGGKYGYAAELYRRGAGDLDKSVDTSVYTPEGEAKFGKYDPQNSPIGLANAYGENTAFPLASWYQYLKQYSPTAGSGLSQTLGAADGDDTAAMSKLNSLRQNYNRMTPVIPDGIDSEAYQNLGRRLSDSDYQLAGWNSAFVGPKVADAYNATPLAAFGKMDRSYLSPAAQTAIEAVGESVTDPINLMTNAAIPFAGAALRGAGSMLTEGLKAGAKTAGNSLIRGLAKAPANIIGDIGEEQVEGTAIAGPALTGWQDWFAAEKNNALMGDKDPNDPDYDEEFQRRSLDARQEQYDVASDLADLTEEEKRKPAPDRRKKPGSFTVPSIL